MINYLYYHYSKLVSICQYFFAFS